MKKTSSVERLIRFAVITKAIRYVAIAAIVVGFVWWVVLPLFK